MPTDDDGDAIIYWRGRLTGDGTRALVVEGRAISEITKLPVARWTIPLPWSQFQDEGIFRAFAIAPGDDPATLPQVGTNARVQVANPNRGGPALAFEDAAGAKRKRKRKTKNGGAGGGGGTITIFGREVAFALPSTDEAKTLDPVFGATVETPCVQTVPKKVDASSQIAQVGGEWGTLTALGISAMTEEKLAAERARLGVRESAGGYGSVNENTGLNTLINPFADGKNRKKTTLKEGQYEINFKDRGASGSGAPGKARRPQGSGGTQGLGP